LARLPTYLYEKTRLSFDAKLAASSLAAFLGRSLARGRSLLGLRSPAEAAAAAARFDAMMRTREEHAEWLAAARERNAQLRREQVMRYARDHMLPRVDLGDNSGGGGGGGGGGLRLLPLERRGEAGGGSGDDGLSPANRHVVAGATAFGPLAAFLLFAAWHSREVPPPPPPLSAEAARAATPAPASALAAPASAA
jgi:hypothetical protein